MKNLKRIVFLSVIVFIYGCANRHNQNEPMSLLKAPIVQINYFPNKDSTVQGREEFKPPVLYSAQNKIFYPKSKIEIWAFEEPIGIRLGVSSSPSPESKYNEIDTGSYQGLFDGKKYTITRQKLDEYYSKELPNNRFFAPPNKSATKNIPIAGNNTIKQPATIPGDVSGIVICQKRLHAPAPKSCAA